jgi:hypothetical protein
VGIDELQSLLHAPAVEFDRAASVAEPEPIDAEVLLEEIENHRPGLAEPILEANEVPPPFADQERIISTIVAEMAAEPASPFQQPASLYQDFSVRCRMHRLSGNSLDPVHFRRRFAMALAGIADPTDPRHCDIVELATSVPADLLAPFLLLARTAQDQGPCPDDEALARIYGTTSPGRVRRLIDYLEKSGLIVVRTDFAGRRSIGIPGLGLSTAPVES